MQPAVPSDSLAEWTAPADSLNTLEGVVCLEAKGEPLRRMTVEVTVSGRQHISLTDAAGHYLILGLPEGVLEVRVRGIGYYPEARSIIFGQCGQYLLSTTRPATDSSLHGFNPVTCRHRQWLAFYMRPLPIVE